MGQKVNPIANRLGIIRGWDSNWYGGKDFSDKLVEDARKVTDEEERKSEYRKACKLLGEDMPVIPIMFYAHDHIGSERIQSLYYDPAGIAHLGEASVQA